MTDAEMIHTTAPDRQLERLRAIMHRLRAPGGCPWDAEQTHESLVSNLIEEAYETVDAIQRGDIEHLCEELGDLLLQVVFHSELAEEAKHFNLDDVARGISDKLIRRHPHIFAGSGSGTKSSARKRAMAKSPTSTAPARACPRCSAPPSSRRRPPRSASIGRRSAACWGRCTR